MASSDAFFNAIQGGEVDQARSILDAGQDVNATLSGRGLRESPIFLALRVREDAMLELILECGADVNQVSTQWGFTPLHKIACCSLPVRRPASKAQLLLSHGAEVDSRDDWGSTPLHKAAMVGNESLVEFFIQNGADLNAVNRDGRTPLHNACIGMHVNVARVLIEQGANLNASDNKGRMPINCAIGRACEPVRLFLMEAHAKRLLAADNAHPGLWAQAFATVGHKKAPGRLSLLFSLLQTKPDLFGYLQQE